VPPQAFVEQLSVQVAQIQVGPGPLDVHAAMPAVTVEASGSNRIDPSAVKSLAPGGSAPPLAQAAPAPALASQPGGAVQQVQPVEQVGRAILAHAEVATAEGRIDFHLRVEPPELGQVRVQLTLTDHALTARLVVHDAGARQLIQSQIESLRQRLQEAGLSVGQFDVSAGGGGDGGPGRWQQQTAPPSVPDISPSRGASGAVTSLPGTPHLPAGRIDVMV
jgi:flagellar hook-length control protein FliK